MGQDASPTATSLDAIYAYDGALVLTRGNITRMVQETCMIDSSKLTCLPHMLFCSLLRGQ